MDGRLLHNSSEYENIRPEGFQHTPDRINVHLRQIFQEVLDNLPKPGTLRHGSFHYIRDGNSKHVSIPVAYRLASQGVLLATIILPDSTPPCTELIVATLAYQLAQNIHSSAKHMLAALRRDPGIFERNTETQFEELVKIPLEMACMNALTEEKSKWPNMIVLGGNAQEFAPGSVAHKVLQLLSMLPVNTITHIDVQEEGLKSRLRSFAQMFWGFVLSLFYYFTA
ncbi:hypothetical protein D9619_000301 [Psilocybe cf. subviscida]|uniref:Uncharacterized protein n=1 Tax=Psilocybe cf. subviscida TaxID=2480587 RepID=A0A8H5BGN9_9AGAR|nr:hypothetical protein D9619_000301 [Psilocybe cf. subviscida]